MKNRPVPFTAIFVFVSLFIVASGSARAETSAPNVSDTFGGHMHLVVPNAAKHREIWKLLGGVEKSSGPLKALMFPGMFILLTQAQPSSPSAATTISNLAFTVNDYGRYKAKLQAVGADFIFDDGEGQVMVDLPDGVRVAMILDAKQQAPIVFQHTRMTAENGEAQRQWYVDVFGGQIADSNEFPSAVILGDRVDFQPINNGKPLPTQGAAIDHIGFEVADLNAFAEKMDRMDIAFDREPMCIEAINLCIAFFTDPYGTYIEVTEGLAALSR